MLKSAVLLVNLGSPNSTSIKDVRNYLYEFLMDGRVIDAPKLIRSFIVNCYILPTRPKASAKAYKSIWTESGSPLIHTSKLQQQALQEKTDIPIYLAMRYGSPSIASIVAKLKKEAIGSLYLVPLYPHYAMSSYETVVVEVEDQLRKQNYAPQMSLLQPFYNHPEYIQCLLRKAQPYLENGYDQLLFSYHGIPERHIRKSDPSHAHCLRSKDCCQRTHPIHATCYRHQCYETTRLFAEAAGLKPENYQQSFQSRLGRDPWLRPFTDKTVERLGKEGMKKLLVICPSFVTDCLETLQEIAIEAKEIFKKAGGESLTLIPCLNTEKSWIEFLYNRIEEWQKSLS